MPILFYSTRDDFGAFSNFSKHGIEMQGKWYRTAEHYFQSRKFDDSDYRERIRNAPNAKVAADLGRSRKVPLRDDWEAIKDGVMFEAVLVKFSTHQEIRDLLLGTGSELIIENAPGDYYWGCGKDGTGLNTLGEILMQVRERLRPAT